MNGLRPKGVTLQEGGHVREWQSLCSSVKGSWARIPTLPLLHFNLQKVNQVHGILQSVLSKVMGI